MPTLHLGYIDQPYSNVPSTGAGRRRRRRQAGGGATTGAVGSILEAKYHIWEHFWELHGQEVADDVTKGLKATIDSLLAGAPPSIDPFGAATSATEDRFKTMLSGKELDSLGYPGIPTRASLLGVSHRFKRRRGPPRPSFIDTGMLQASAKVWMES